MKLFDFVLFTNIFILYSVVIFMQCVGGLALFVYFFHSVSVLVLKSSAMKKALFVIFSVNMLVLKKKKIKPQQSDKLVHKIITFPGV